MYGIGERVVYGAHGVCCVTGMEERTVDRKKCVYLVLEPMVNSTSRYYIPTHNAVAMAKLSPLLSREELEAMLSSPSIRNVDWVPDENRRKQLYRELIAGVDRERLMRAVYALYRHKEHQAAAGKKFHICDENFLHDAERVLSGEIENILGIENQEAKDYLKRHLA